MTSDARLKVVCPLSPTALQLHIAHRALRRFRWQSRKGFLLRLLARRFRFSGAGFLVQLLIDRRFLGKP